MVLWSQCLCSFSGPETLPGMTDPTWGADRKRHRNDFGANLNPAVPGGPQPGELAEGGHAASGCGAVGLPLVLVWPFLPPVQCGTVCRVGAAGPRPSTNPLDLQQATPGAAWIYLPTCQLVPGTLVSDDSPSDFGALVNPLTVWSCSGSRWWNSAYILALSSSDNWSDLGALGL